MSSPSQDVSIKDEIADNFAGVDADGNLQTKSKLVDSAGTDIDANNPLPTTAEVAAIFDYHQKKTQEILMRILRVLERIEKHLILITDEDVEDYDIAERRDK
jgi:hypothetical protein